MGPWRNLERGTLVTLESGIRENLDIWTLETLESRTLETMETWAGVQLRLAFERLSPALEKLRLSSSCDGSNKVEQAMNPVVGSSFLPVGEVKEAQQVIGGKRYT